MADTDTERKQGSADDDAEGAPKRLTEVPALVAHNTMADLLARTRFGGERFVITHHGKPAAALVSVQDLQTILAAA